MKRSRGSVMQKSRIYIVDVVEEVHDHSQHRLAEAYFVTSFATKNAQALRFYRVFALLIIAPAL